MKRALAVLSLLILVGCNRNESKPTTNSEVDSPKQDQQPQENPRSPVDTDPAPDKPNPPENPKPEVPPGPRFLPIYKNKTWVTKIGEFVSGKYQGTRKLENYSPDSKCFDPQRPLELPKSLTIGRIFNESLYLRTPAEEFRASRKTQVLDLGIDHILLEIRFAIANSNPVTVNQSCRFDGGPPICDYETPEPKNTHCEVKLISGSIVDLVAESGNWELESKLVIPGQLVVSKTLAELNCDGAISNVESISAKFYTSEYATNEFSRCETRSLFAIELAQRPGALNADFVKSTEITH